MTTLKKFFHNYYEFKLSKFLIHYLGVRVKLIYCTCKCNSTRLKFLKRREGTSIYRPLTVSCCNFQPHVTFIDRITLAVFEDSGWYKVDYRSADVYVWGKSKNILNSSS